MSVLESYSFAYGSGFLGKGGENVEYHNVHYPDEFLITHILHTIEKNSHDNITICKIRAHTNTLNNEEAEKLTKIGVETQHIIDTPYHLIGHQIPY